MVSLLPGWRAINIIFVSVFIHVTQCYSATVERFELLRDNLSYLTIMSDTSPVVSPLPGWRIILSQLRGESPPRLVFQRERRKS